MKVDVSKIEGVLRKLSRKDPTTFRAVTRKISQISELDAAAVQHFKNLRAPLSHLKRVHVGSFVLVFRVAGDVVIFEGLPHHDAAYK